jgi:hypothetical protein
VGFELVKFIDFAVNAVCRVVALQTQVPADSVILLLDQHRADMALNSVIHGLNHKVTVVDRLVSVRKRLDRREFKRFLFDLHNRGVKWSGGQYLQS